MALAPLYWRSRPPELALAPLPCWKHLSAEAYRARIASLIQQIEEDAAAQRQASGRPRRMPRIFEGGPRPASDTIPAELPRMNGGSVQKGRGSWQGGRSGLRATGEARAGRRTGGGGRESQNGILIPCAPWKTSKRQPSNSRRKDAPGWPRPFFRAWAIPARMKRSRSGPKRRSADTRKSAGVTWRSRTQTKSSEKLEPGASDPSLLAPVGKAGALRRRRLLRSPR
jgi:hypothetical protein